MGKADLEPIRLSPARIKDLKDRMRATSIGAAALKSDPPDLEQFLLEYEARCSARAIVHEHIAYELARGAEWELALSVLARPFECDEYHAADQIANSMLGVDYLLERRKTPSSRV